MSIIRFLVPLANPFDLVQHIVSNRGPERILLQVARESRKLGFYSPKKFKKKIEFVVPGVDISKSEDDAILLVVREMMKLIFIILLLSR